MQEEGDNKDDAPRMETCSNGETVDGHLGQSFLGRDHTSRGQALWDKKNVEPTTDCLYLIMTDEKTI